LQLFDSLGAGYLLYTLSETVERGSGNDGTFGLRLRSAQIRLIADLRATLRWLKALVARTHLLRVRNASEGLLLGSRRSQTRDRAQFRDCHSSPRTGSGRWVKQELNQIRTSGAHRDGECGKLCLPGVQVLGESGWMLDVPELQPMRGESMQPDQSCVAGLGHQFGAFHDGSREVRAVDVSVNGSWNAAESAPADA